MSIPYPMTTLELTAVKVEPDDLSAPDALDRVQESEGKPVDDATWQAMVTVAERLAGPGRVARWKRDRPWGSVQAAADHVLVEVLWQGGAAHVYFTTEPGTDAEFRDLVDRFRSEGFTLLEAGSLATVAPKTSLGDLVARQRERGA